MKKPKLIIGQYARNLTTNQTCEILDIQDAPEFSHNGKPVRMIQIKEVYVDKNGGFNVVDGKVQMYIRWIFEDLLKPISKLV